MYSESMTNKEQLLYFFLQGKVSLSQYDYKFMANLQTMIQNKNRVTSNQATLFDNLISKYKKQLTKLDLDKETLKALPWKTMVVESTPEYTGATVYTLDDDIVIRVPFNKTFITAFRNEVPDNTYMWDRENKVYKSQFTTTALKVAVNFLGKYFNTVRYSDDIVSILSDLEKYNAPINKPTLIEVNGRFIVAACNEVLGELVKDKTLSKNPRTLFELAGMGITIDEAIYANEPKLEFAAKNVYEDDIENLETIIGWIKELGCENVVVGRGLRSYQRNDNLNSTVLKYGMNLMAQPGYGKLPNGMNMLIQHTSSIDVRMAFMGQISKTVVVKDSRPIEVK